MGNEIEPVRGHRPLPARPFDPVTLILARIRQGLYSLCAIGVAGVIGGSFLIELTVPAVVAGISTSLLCGASGLVLEVIEKARGGERYE